MGYGVNRFIGPIDPNLICGICSSVLEDAVLTPCGHSFCLLCLETWLTRCGTSTCPECRSHVQSNEAKPIHSMRNLINGFEVECVHTERGCKVIVKLDRIKSHVETCGYFPVECAGCAVTVNRFELANHQMQCAGIAAAVKDDDAKLFRRVGNLRVTTSSSAEVSDLHYRINCLEFQVKNLKRDMQIADSKNRVLEREYKKAKDELQQKRNELINLQYSEYDHNYEYGFTPQSVAKLSLLIARFLLVKPEYVNRDKIFSSIKRCYEQYARCGNEFEHDVHMLVATAFASNWFSESQRLNFHCWLQSIARHRQLSNTINAYNAAMCTPRN